MDSEEEKRLLQDVIRLEKEINNLKKKQSEFADVAYRYKHSPFDVCYLMGRRIKHSKYFEKSVNTAKQMKHKVILLLKSNKLIFSLYQRLKRIRNEKIAISSGLENISSISNNLPTITVVIPTYKPTEYLSCAVNSIIQQEYDKGKIKILIVVNGSDIEYFYDLKERWMNNENILVVYTEKKGVGAARNYAKKYLTTDYVTYLDDDDYFTSGYLREMAQYSSNDVTIICGRLVDLVDKWDLFTNTYINNALKNAGNTVHNDYSKIESLFSSFNMKLYKRELITDILGDFNEGVPHTEDVLFWVQNIGKVVGDIYTCKANSSEAYVRRVTKNSLSRPEEAKCFNFYITDRIALIEEFEKELYKAENDMKHKEFVLHKITVNLQTMNKYFSGLLGDDKIKARMLIDASNSCFINKTLFAERKGIAFCHNFSPSVDASAFVASKRLSQISLHVGETIAWTVISADMSSCRKQDILWEDFYARFQYVEKFTTKIPTGFNEEAQFKWGKYAYNLTIEKAIEVDYIYSRSMWAGSHVAAYLYKKNHPDVKWYAEFSDPIYMGTDNAKRKPSNSYLGEKSFFNSFWKDLEEVVFQNADFLIFTNENQCKYMLENNIQKNESQILSKSIIWNHPVVNNLYTKIVESNIKINDSKINIGYFGTFYPNRDYKAMLTLLEDERFDVYIFTNITDDLEKLEKSYSNLYIHPMITQLEFLNLASRMDYCYLNDIKFDGDINPYLPSKLADYLAAGVQVLALTYPNSPMDKYENEKIYKVREINVEILKSLKKRNHNVKFV